MKNQNGDKNMDINYLAIIFLFIFVAFSAYYITRSYVTAILIFVVFLIMVLMFFVVHPLITEMLETEKENTIDMSEIQDTIRPGDVAFVSSNVTVYSSNDTNLLLELPFDAPVPQHFQYNSDKELYEIKSTDLSDYTSIMINYSNITYHLNYSKQIMLNNTIIPGMFPINKTEHFKFTIKFVAPENFTDSLFLLANYNPEKTIDMRPKPESKEKGLFDDFFDDHSLLSPMLMIILFIIPMTAFIVWEIVAYIPRKRKYPSYENIKRDVDNITKPKPESKFVESKYGRIKKKRGDYTLLTLTTVDVALEKAKEYRENNHWTKIKNYAKNPSESFDSKKCCALYVSNWSKDDLEDKGYPKWT